MVARAQEVTHAIQAVHYATPTRLHRATFHERLRLPLEAAQSFEVEGITLAGRSDTSQHAASYPFPSVVMELRPFAVRRTFDVSGFSR